MREVPVLEITYRTRDHRVRSALTCNSNIICLLQRQMQAGVADLLFLFFFFFVGEAEKEISKETKLIEGHAPFSTLFHLDTASHATGMFNVRKPYREDKPTSPHQQVEPPHIRYCYKRRLSGSHDCQLQVTSLAC